MHTNFMATFRNFEPGASCRSNYFDVILTFNFQSFMTDDFMGIFLNCYCQETKKKNQAGFVARSWPSHRRNLIMVICKYHVCVNLREFLGFNEFNDLLLNIDIH